MVLDRASITSLREHLSSRSKLDDLLECFVHTTVAEEAEDEKDEEKKTRLSEFLEFLLLTVYRKSADNIHRYSESEIEKIFLSSLLICFLKADPLRFVVSEPAPDLVLYTTRYRDLLAMLDRMAGDEAGRTIRERSDEVLRRLRARGDEIGASPDEVNYLHAEYMMMRVLGFNDAFFLTPQAGLPDIKVSGRAVRLDACVWRPLDPTFRVAVECDGYEYHQSQDQFTHDRRRDRMLKQRAFEVFRFSGSEIFHHPAEVAVDLFDFLQKNAGTEED